MNAKAPKYPKVGDVVRLVVPRRVERVGYRLSFAEAREVVEMSEGRRLTASILAQIGTSSGKARAKIEDALAYALVAASMEKDPVRRIHYADMNPDDVERQYHVVGKLTARTGRYYPPTSGGRDYFGDYEPGDPGGLLDPKTHALVVLSRYPVGIVRPVFQVAQIPDLYRQGWVVASAHDIELAHRPGA